MNNYIFSIWKVSLLFWKLLANLDYVKKRGTLQSQVNDILRLLIIDLLSLFFTTMIEILYFTIFFYFFNKFYQHNSAHNGAIEVFLDGHHQGLSFSYLFHCLPSFLFFFFNASVANEFYQIHLFSKLMNLCILSGSLQYFF